MKELQDLFPDFAFSNDEENIPHTEHDVVNVKNMYEICFWVPIWR